MSRFIKNPIPVPDGVNVVIADGVVRMTGPAGEVARRLDDSRLAIEQGEDGLRVRTLREGDAVRALAGCYWRLLEGMARGASSGIVKVLELVGVGYRAQVNGADIVLQLGFSHPVRYTLPPGVSVVAPSATELVVKGADKSLVGQVAADLRAARPPEPYKGKGVRYRGERVIIKETKKK